MIKVAAVVFVAALAGYGFHAWAQARIDVRPTVTSVMSSSSNGVSFAWFYDTTTQSIYVCRAGQGVADTLECKAKTILP
jgi:hypothetical protein